MKKQSNMLFTSLSNRDMANLTKEVEETIAFGLISSRPKVFTAAELWNVQRQKKPIPQRRFL
ncbi:MAG: hypothetical protein JWP81_2999 [Ferruginibacter sp.]|nr:hypothetical protein [Ferruginibacter sp.]